MRIFPLETYLLIYPIDNYVHGPVGYSCAIIFLWHFLTVAILETYICLTRSRYGYLEPTNVVVLVFNLFSTSGTLIMSLILAKRKIFLTWMTWTILAFFLQLTTTVVIAIELWNDLSLKAVLGYTTKYLLAVLECSINVIPFFFNWFIVIYAWLSIHTIYELEYLKHYEVPLTDYEKILIERAEFVGDILENDYVNSIEKRRDEEVEYMPFFEEIPNEDESWSEVDRVQQEVVESDVRQVIPPDDRLPMNLNSNFIERKRVAGARIRENKEGDTVKEAFSIDDEIENLEDYLGAKKFQNQSDSFYDDQYNQNYYKENDNEFAKWSYTEEIPTRSVITNEPVVDVYVRKK